MNEFEASTTPTPGAGLEQLRSELQFMRGVLTASLLMLIGLSICGDYYLSRQTQAMNAESTQLESVAAAFPQAAANDFVARLKEYAKTHPDFAPITTKYANVFSAPPPQKK